MSSFLVRESRQTLFKSLSVSVADVLFKTLKSSLVTPPALGPHPKCSSGRWRRRGNRRWDDADAFRLHDCWFLGRHHFRSGLQVSLGKPPRTLTLTLTLCHQPSEDWQRRPELPNAVLTLLLCTLLSLFSAHLRIQAEDPGHLWGAQPARDARRPGRHRRRRDCCLGNHRSLWKWVIIWCCGVWERFGQMWRPGVSLRMEDVFPDVADGSIDASKQGGVQALSLVITLGIALLGGLIVGKCLRFSNLLLKNSWTRLWSLTSVGLSLTATVSFPSGCFATLAPSRSPSGPRSSCGPLFVFSPNS